MVFPRAYLVKDITVVSSEEEAIHKTRDLGTSTRDILVLEEEPTKEVLEILN